MSSTNRQGRGSAALILGMLAKDLEREVHTLLKGHTAEVEPLSLADVPDSQQIRSFLDSTRKALQTAAIPEKDRTRLEGVVENIEQFVRPTRYGMSFGRVA